MSSVSSFLYLFLVRNETSCNPQIPPRTGQSSVAGTEAWQPPDARAGTLTGSGQRSQISLLKVESVLLFEKLQVQLK